MYGRYWLAVALFADATTGVIAQPGGTTCKAPDGTSRTLTERQCTDQDGKVCTATEPFDPTLVKGKPGTNCISIGELCACCGAQGQQCTGEGGAKGCICTTYPPGFPTPRCHGCDSASPQRSHLADAMQASGTTCKAPDGTSRTLTERQCTDQDGKVCTAAKPFDPALVKGGNCVSLGPDCACCGAEDMEQCTGQGGNGGCICGTDHGLGGPLSFPSPRCHGCDQARLQMMPTTLTV